jgi:glutamine synthetase
MSNERIRPLFTDLYALPRGKYVPRSMADGGKIGFCRSVFGVPLDRDIVPAPGAGLFEGLPDMDLMLDGDYRDSWQGGTKIALGDLYADGEPFGLCGRSLLKRSVSEWQAHGYSPKIGIEMEAYVFEQNDEGVWKPYNTPGAFVYGTGPANDPYGLMDQLWEVADACGLPIESMNGEYDSGQFELTMQFDDALKAADDAFLFRTMAKEVAANLGLILTFLPKPIPERGGNGFHVNFSFADKKGGNAVAPKGELSDLSNSCIAGLIHHHEALAGWLANTVNSYDRLGPASMAGYWANWANDHRMVTLRTTKASPKSARLEHRTADCAGNPYIQIAAVLQAAKLGVENGYKMPAEEKEDAVENVSTDRHVPTSLTKAMDAVEKDTALGKAMGEFLTDNLLFMKRDEAERLDGKSQDEVRDYYLPFI